MRLRSLPLGVGLVFALFGFDGPMTFWHRLATLLVAVILIVIGLVAIGTLGVIDRVLPQRTAYGKRDLNNAYRAGRDQGAAEGPSESTLRRWKREGFEEPGI